MKKYNYLFLLLMFPLFSWSQSSGIITYEQEITFEIPESMKDKPEMQSIITQMPKSMKSKRELLFTDKEHILRNVIEEEATNEGGGNGMFFNFKRPDEQFYYNLETDENIHMQDFFRKTFLITDEAKKREWKMTKEQDVIMDYLCFKAVTGDSTDRVVAWFTPQIPTKAAPGFLHGLPGMILKASFGEEGNVTLTATDVKLEELEDDAIVKPTKGKKVTSEEYKEIVKKKTEEMREQYGGKGFFITD